MNNNFQNLRQSLPRGERVYLSIPDIGDMEHFLQLVNKNTDFHLPWVQAPDDENKYKKYINRINFESQVSFFVKRSSDEQVVGAININEIVSGAFQSGYLGYYGFKESSGLGLMSEGISLSLVFYFENFEDA